MKSIKDITLLAFAVIGFYAIITVFTTTESNQPQQIFNGTPESHVWTSAGKFSIERHIILNKVTGEIRMLKPSGYQVLKEKK